MRWLVFDGREIVGHFEALGVTHVIWVPDSTMGPWESALDGSHRLRLLRVCREGEAWPLAAGLFLGGKFPILLLQTTGLFESGDALRNILFDLHLPLFAVIGARNWLRANSTDSARRFTQPILEAWGVDCRWITCVEHLPVLGEHYRHCREKHRAGFVILGEE